MNRATVLAILLLATPALAQPGPGYPQGGYPQAQPPAAPPAQAAAEQQIASLQAQLRITPDQAGPWTAFVQAMREGARTTDAQFGQRYGRMQSMDAASNLEAYAQSTRAYADSNERVAASFRRLYDALTPSQRQAADAMFRQPPPQR